MVIKPLAAGLLLAALVLAAPAQASRIAFIRGTDVNTMKPDGSAVRQLTSFGPDRGATLEAWSPDASMLVFDVFATDFSAPVEIWAMNADGSNQHLVLAEPDYDDFTPSFSPDGRHVIFARCSRVEGIGCGIHQMRLDGTHLTAITPIQREISDWAPIYSPDGRTIMFGGFARRGVIATTYLMDADGSHIRPIAPPELQLFPGEWSPDGSRIALGSNCCNPRNGDVWTVKPNGKGRTQLMDTPDENDVRPTWSPQGDAIAFERVRPDFSDSDAFVMRPDGSHVKQIQTHARYVRWAPAH
jgi:TolB protein